MRNTNKERTSGMVRVRGGFSDTNGIMPCNTILQVDEFDDISRRLMGNKLFYFMVIVFDTYPDCLANDSLHNQNYSDMFCKDLLNDVFCESNDLEAGRTYKWRGIYRAKIKAVIDNATYNEVLDIIQYSCRWIESRINPKEGYLYKGFNRLFEDEYIGYRFVDGRIIPITSKVEIEAIEDACQNPFEGCRTQIKKAVGFLSDRENKDYKNCIKESISAVESICQVVVGEEHATLGDALKQLEAQGITIHAALKQAFLKLYGYTSDKGGVRHAEGMFESDVSFEEAKFMLVSCSAFINYLIALFAKGDN